MIAALHRPDINVHRVGPGTENGPTGCRAAERHQPVATMKIGIPTTDANVASGRIALPDTLSPSDPVDSAFVSAEYGA